DHFRWGLFQETLAEGTKGAPHLGPKRPRVYSDLSLEEKDRSQATIQDGRVVVQNVQGRLNQGQGNNLQGGGAAGQENGVALDEEQLLFLADDCDVFDFDVDEAPTAQTMFMVNLSSADHVYDEAGPSYDSDILSEGIYTRAFNWAPDRIGEESLPGSSACSSIFIPKASISIE
nr:hypothetical protein [Tanacetum cinerariifolium]